MDVSGVALCIHEMANLVAALVYYVKVSYLVLLVRFECHTYDVPRFMTIVPPV